ncbi:MAG: IS200/IS605 family transposase [Acidobacteriales bacterium]|nr:IS200/IS605 family transposase [Terriglobales bacterium]
MAHTYVTNLLHVVFATKGRIGHIRPEVEGKMWAYLAAVAKGEGAQCIIAGGMPNHIHLLLSVPARIPLSDLMQHIKGNSSKWFHEKHAPQFRWQQGYAAFSVSESLKDKTVEYIRNQKEHHKRRDFESEYLALLKKHGVKYDPRYVFD